MATKRPRLYEPLPIQTGWSRRNERFLVSSLAGRRGILCFIGSGADPIGRAIYDLLFQLSVTQGLGEAFVILVTHDPEDRARLQEAPQLVIFHDENRTIGRACSVGEGMAETPPFSFVLDQRLRIFAEEAASEPRAHVLSLLAKLAQLPLIKEIGKGDGWAPVLAVPRVFENQLCKALIDYFDASGGRPSGFMREKDGRTYGVMDKDFKSRNDCRIEDPQLRDACRHRIFSRLLPEIARAFQFHVTHIERDIIACYDAQDRGHFNPHRDNTTKGTAHRRFAVSINLNAEDFDGGDLRFPEFSQTTYRPQTGGAIVFSCSLLHEATTITRGRRYCYLPFLYDAAAAQIRDQNAAHLDLRTYAADETTVLYDPNASPVLEKTPVGK